MYELKFYTDGEKVYLNNDKGVTKEVDLSALFGGDDGGDDGGSEDLTMIVNFSDTPDQYGYLISDKTCAEIYSAMASGKNVILHVPTIEAYSSDEFYYPMVGIAYSEENQTYSIEQNSVSLGVITGFSTSNGYLRATIYMD